MSQRPDGKAARTERVVFTRPAAERISKVVRIVEAGNRQSAPLRFERTGGAGSKVFRICTFTGTWNIDTDRTVTLRNVTTTPNTLVATNLFADVGGGGTASTYPCAVGKDGTAWYLIAAKCTATCG